MEIEKYEFGHVPGFDMLEKLNIARDILHEEVCKVKFTKVDGSEREMICTLRSDLLPPLASPSEQAKLKKSVEESGVLAVFLPNEQTWRSFKVDNLISIEVCDEA